VRRALSLFEGCYDAGRAAALAGVPASTVYDWARKGVVVPSVSRARPKLWSYADLMALRIVYWLRHPKFDLDAQRVPASPMQEVRCALLQLDDEGIDLWKLHEGRHLSPLLVRRNGQIVIDRDGSVSTLEGQGFIDREYLDVLGPFDADESWGPDLRRPMPHLRIVPGKLSGEPHLEDSRLTTSAVVALADRGFSVAQIQGMYPDESAEALSEAVELEHRLAA